MKPLPPNRFAPKLHIHLLLLILLSFQLTLWAQSPPPRLAPNQSATTPKLTPQINPPYSNPLPTSQLTLQTSEVSFGPIILPGGSLYDRTQDQVQAQITVTTITTPIRARFEFYKPFQPEPILVAQTETPWWTPPPLPPGQASWEKVFSIALLIEGNSPAVALGEWTVKGYVDSGSGWVETSPATFEIRTQETDPYQFRTYLSPQKNPLRPYIPAEPTTTFYTSNASQGQIIRTFVWDYYFQDPGVGYKSHWYHLTTPPLGQPVWQLYAISSITWSNDPSFGEETWEADFPKIPLSWIVEDRKIGEWFVKDLVVKEWDETLEPEAQHFTEVDRTYFEVLDDVKPTLTIATPDHQETNQPSISIAGQADDDIGVVKVTWSDNFDHAGELTGDDITEWLILGLELEEGENIFTLRAEDKAGNQSDPPQTLTVIKTDRMAEEGEDLCFQVFVPGSDPIDAFTGGQILEHQLLAVKGALSLNFTLRYDSSQSSQWVDKYFSPCRMR